MAVNTSLRFRDILSLASLFRANLSMKVFRLSLLRLVYKVSSMLIMFIPIKIFIIIASGSEMSFLDSYQKMFSFNLTLTFLFSSLIFVYFIYLCSQLFLPRLISRERGKFRGVVNVNYLGVDYSRVFLRKVYGNVVNFLSDFFLIIASLIICFSISIDYSIFYLSILFVFYMIIEYLVLTKNRFNFLAVIDVGAADFISFCSSLIFLAAFSGVFWFYYISNMEIYDGILLMMVSRLANSAVKGLAMSNHKVHLHYQQLGK